MKILRDGVFFSQGDSLAACAAIAGEDVSRYSFDPADLAQHERAEFKKTRQQAVDSIVVTTAAGNQFDGDEVSQGRMARAILGLQAAGPDSSVLWVLSDNSVIQASAGELAEALALAGAEQARLWVAA